ncbi:hypothetical protein ES705_34984 [subsurface metagenome]
MAKKRSKVEIDLRKRHIIGWGIPAIIIAFGIIIVLLYYVYRIT